MPIQIDWVLSSICLFFFISCPVIGLRPRWKSELSEHLDDGGLCGRAVRHLDHLVLVGVGFYNRLRRIAVPALVYGVGAYGSFALPTPSSLSLCFAVMPVPVMSLLNGHVHRGDVVHGTTIRAGFDSPVAITGRSHHALYRAATDRDGRVTCGLGRPRIADRGPVIILACVHLSFPGASPRADRLLSGQSGSIVVVLVAVVIRSLPAEVDMALCSARPMTRVRCKGRRDWPDLNPSRCCLMRRWPWVAFAAFNVSAHPYRIFASKSADTIRRMRSCCAYKLLSA